MQTITEPTQIAVDANATYILTCEPTDLSWVDAIYPNGAPLRIISDLMNGQYALVPPTSTIELYVMSGELRYELTRSFNISAIPMRDGGDVFDPTEAIASHDYSRTAHRDIRDIINTSMIPAGGWEGQILTKTGSYAGKCYWQTAPWLNERIANDRYISRGSEIITDYDITTHGSISAKYGVDYQSYGDGVNYGIVCKRGVLGYLPTPNGIRDTSFAGFVPFGAGVGLISSQQYNCSQFVDTVPFLDKGIYQINLTYYYKQDGAMRALPDKDYDDQMSWLRPFVFDSAYKVYTSTMSLIDAPAPGGQFSNNPPSTLAIRNLIDPNDDWQNRLIINPGDYVDSICAGNKYPWTGYAYINISLLLQSNNDALQLFNMDWHSLMASHYSTYVNLTITKLQ